MERQAAARLERFDPGFEEELRSALRGAPWIGVSLALHLLAIALLLQFDFRQEVERRELVLAVGPVPEDVEILEQQQPPPQKPVEPDRVVEQQVDDPVVTDDQEVELPSDIESETLSLVPAPFTGRGSNDVIGPSGGGGGPNGPGGGPRGPVSRAPTATQVAVDRGLWWLRRHQDPLGCWDSDGFAGRCSGGLCSGKGHALNDVGNTGLALLAFLGAGHTPSSGRHQDAVKSGLRWLASAQDPDDGCLGSKSGHHFLYGHAIATLALVEAWHLSGLPALKAPAQRALGFVSRARNPYAAWRYAYPPDGDNDVSVTGWMLFALFAGKEAGLEVDDAAIKDGMAFIESMTDPATHRTGYREKGSLSAREAGSEERWPADQAEAMSAVATLLRIFHQRESGPEVAGATRLMLAKPPRWDVAAGSIDFCYWYYGSYAMFQAGGRSWEQWSRAMEGSVVGHQRESGCEEGSWDPEVDPWGGPGGRVYSTAINALCLEVYYRYDRLLGSR